MRTAIWLVERPPIAASLAAGWVALFMPPAATWAWLAVPLCMVGVALRTVAPMIGAAMVLAASAICTAAGAPYAEIEMLVPTMGVLYWLGRYRSTPAVGAVFMIGFICATSLRVDAPWHSFLAGVLVYGAPWVFGRVVRRRAQDARDAAAQSARLAAVDLDQLIGDSASAERNRLTRESLMVLRSAIERMRALVSAGDSRFDSLRADTIRAEGEQAIGILHGILASLSEHQRAAMPGAQSPDAGRSRWWSAPVVALALAGIAVCGGAAFMVAGAHVPLLTLAVVMPLAAVLASVYPRAAGIAAAIALALASMAPAFRPDALLPIAVCLLVVIWRLVNSGQLLALVATAAGAGFLGLQFGRQGAGFVLVVVVLAMVSAHAWQEKDRIVLEEQTRSARLSASIATARRRAEQAERDRVARELHDGVSYAITAMTVQAQAAVALADHDPAGSHRCVDIVRDVGDTALLEIDEITRHWQRTHAADKEPTDIQAVIAGAQALGQRIHHLARDAATDRDRLVRRIVQESLTNVARYAPGAEVTIETGTRDAQRFVRVVDSGGVQPPTSQCGLGTGLDGLARRVAECGGEFRAEPHDEGFEVFAQWPVRTMVSANPQPGGGR